MHGLPSVVDRFFPLGWATVAALSVHALACSGSTTDSPSGGATGGAAGAGGSGVGGATGGMAGSGATGGTAGSGGTAGGLCPAAPPDQGSACVAPWTPEGFDPANAHCSWGDDPRPGCRTLGRCTEGAWQVTTPDAQACAAPPLPPACTTPPPADQSECPDSSLSCWYDDGTRCWCSACQGGSGYPVCQVVDPPQWYCATPAGDCPAQLPQAGAPCDIPGASCGPDCNLTILCSGGVWQWLQGNCPICAAPDTPIATPGGERPIASLRPGDLVYSVDHDAIVVVPIARIGRTPVALHHVVHLVLADGSVLQLSPGHPTADGRTVGDLHPSSRLDESHTVVSASLVPYEYDATYDILPASDTGTYFAGGALLGSSLF